MNIAVLQAITLSASEKILLATINFESNIYQPDLDPNGLAAAELTQSLLKRKAIPELRLRYFADPKLNIGGRGKSRKEVFEANGIEGEAMFRHPHFLPYLKYFIFGPDLPAEAITPFICVIEEELGSSGMILNQLCRVARAKTRRLTREKRQNAPEEFFKLSLETGLNSGMARSIRDVVRNSR